MKQSFKFSENELSLMTGFNRLTVRRRLLTANLAFEEGPRGAKLYQALEALPIIFGIGGEGDSKVSQAEAQRLLTIAKENQIALDIEIKKKERIPMVIVAEYNERVFSNISGTLKSWRGKKLTEQGINDLLTELRSIGDKIKEWTGSAQQLTDEA